MRQAIKGKVPKNALRPGDRAILYIRVSDVGDRGDDLISDDVQNDVCRRWAAAHGVTIVDVIVDLDLSGRSTSKRRINETIERVNAGEAEGVLLWKISRFGRNTLDSLQNVNKLQANGGRIASATENLDDIESAMGRFSLTQMLAIAQLQSDQIGETWTNIHDYRRGSGLPHTAGPRFGYDWHKGEKDPSKVWTPSETTGPWLAKAYRDYVAGRSLLKVCGEMDDNGIRSVKGKRIVYNSLLNTMDTGFGAGLIVDRRESSSRLGTPNNWDYLQGAHEALISEKLWQDYLTKRGEKRAPREKAAVHRVAGVVYCETCKRKATTQKRPRVGGRVYRELRCNHGYVKNFNNHPCTEPFTMSLDRIEQEVFEWLKDQVEGDDAINTALARKARATQAKADVAGIEKEIGRLSKRLSRATDMALDEDDPDARQSFREKAAEIRKEITELRAKAGELSADATVSNMPVQTAFGALVTAWERMDLAQLNEALRKVVWRVYVRPGHKDEVGKVRVVGRWEPEAQA